MSQTKGQIERQIEAGDILDLIISLVDKSLVTYEEDAQGQGRYRLLETVRQYGRDRLLEHGEAKGVCERHKDFFLALAEEAEPELSGLRQISWLDRLETEHDNLRSALGWCTREYGTEEPAEQGLRLAGALGVFWRRRGHRFEGRQWLNRMLELAGERFVTTGQAKALLSTAILAADQGDLDNARTYYERCLALARQKGDQESIAAVLGGLGQIAWFERNNATAQQMLTESLSLFQQMDNPNGIAFVKQNLGSVAYYLGDHATARPLLEDSLRGLKQLGLNRFVPHALLFLGQAVTALGEYETARGLLTEGLTLAQQWKSPIKIAMGLAGFGALAQSQGCSVQATRLLGAAHAQREAHSYRMDFGDQKEEDQKLAAVRLILDEETFATAFATGQAMTLEQAVEYALAGDAQ